MFGTGEESFAELREGLFAEAFGEEPEEGVTDEDGVGQQVGLTGTATVFAHLDIASPMVADFHPAPMSSDPVQPFLGRIRIRWRAGEVVTGLGCRSDHPFLRALAAHDDQGAGKGEVDGQGLDGEGIKLAGFDSAMTGLVVGKKGVSRKASKA